MNVPQKYALPQITFIGGTTQVLSFGVVFDAEDFPKYDLKNCTAEFSLVGYMDRTAPPSFKTSMSVSGNMVEVKLTPSDTDGLLGRYVYQISIRDGAGNVEAFQGNADILRNTNPSFK